MVPKMRLSSPDPVPPGPARPAGRTSYIGLNPILAVEKALDVMGGIAGAPGNRCLRYPVLSGMSPTGRYRVGDLVEEPLIRSTVRAASEWCL